MNQSFLKSKSESFLSTSHQNFQRQFLKLESWVKTEQQDIEQVNAYPRVYFEKNISNQTNCKNCNQKFKNNKKMCFFCGRGYCKKCIVKQRKHLLSQKYKDICQECENLRLKSQLFESFQEKMEILQKQKIDSLETLQQIQHKMEKQQKQIEDEQLIIDKQNDELIQQKLDMNQKEDISQQKFNSFKEKESQLNTQIKRVNEKISLKEKEIKEQKSKKLGLEEQTEYLKRDNHQLQRNKKVLKKQIQELLNKILNSRNIKMEVKGFKDIDESFTMLNQTKSTIFEEVNFRLPQNAEACACKCLKKYKELNLKCQINSTENIQETMEKIREDAECVLMPEVQFKNTNLSCAESVLEKEQQQWVSTNTDDQLKFI